MDSANGSSKDEMGEKMGMGSDGAGKMAARRMRCVKRLGWAGMRQMDSTRCEMQDVNTQMGWRSKMRWKSGGTDGNVKMGLGVSPQTGVLMRDRHITDGSGQNSTLD